MYAVNADEYSRWLSVSNPSTRFWIRAWIDSLHMGTHIHWQLSPLSVLALSYLWSYMAQQEPGYTKHQRTSIKAMARRRQDDPGIVGTMPQFADSDATWDHFFQSQAAATETIRQALIGWHLRALDTHADPPTLMVGLSSLYSALLIVGLRSDRLFQAVCKWVLDPGKQRSTGPADNLVELLTHYTAPPPREFLSYTYMVPLNPEALSRSLLKKWSNLTLPSVDEFNDPRTLPVLLAGNPARPCIITRRRLAGSIAELHRREAIRVYCLRLQLHPSLSVLVFPHRSYFKSTEPGASENYHDVSFKRTQVAIDEIPSDDAGAVLFYKASRDLFDSPEDAIRNLMVAAELRWRRSKVKETDKVLANAYRWALRPRLSRDFADYLSRARTLGESADVRTDSSYRQLALWDWEGEKDFALLLDHITTATVFDDQLTLYRLREIVTWYTEKATPTSELTGLAHTFREIDDLLTLARGVRNSATHFAEGDDALYGVMLYLARVLVEAFTACLTRDTVTAAAAAVATGTPAPATSHAAPPPIGGA